MRIFNVYFQQLFLDFILSTHENPDYNYGNIPSIMSEQENLNLNVGIDTIR